jgi:hypothetical protein
MESIFLNENELARVRPGLPHGGREGGASTLDLSFRTTPGNQTGGTGVSAETALELAHRILLYLEEKGLPTSKPCETKFCTRSDVQPYIEPDSGRLVWLCVDTCHPGYPTFG